MKKIFSFVYIACSYFTIYTANCDSSVIFDNPNYIPGITAQQVTIANGSMLNFASDGIIGTTIRAVSAMNDVPNPLGLTHSGIIINENPLYIYQQLNNLPIDNKQKTKMQKDIYKYCDMMFLENNHIALSSFCMESDGSAIEVIRGILPHVHIHPLQQTLKKYKGNVYFRNLKNGGIHIEGTREFVNEYLGRPYESLITIPEMISAVNEGNTEECTDRVFCSELAAIFYKRFNILDATINVSNIIPEYFSSCIEKYDILYSHAEQDILLKYTGDVKNPEGDDFLGKLIQQGISVYNKVAVK